MPALFVMMKIHTAGDAGLGFEAGDEGGDERAAAGVTRFGQRKQRRQMGADG